MSIIPFYCRFTWRCLEDVQRGYKVCFLLTEVGIELSPEVGEVVQRAYHYIGMASLLSYENMHDQSTVFIFYFV